MLSYSMRMKQKSCFIKEQISAFGLYQEGT